MKKSRSKKKKGERRAVKGRKKLPLIGWRERVSLPDMGLGKLKAKIDTGALTSSLHVSRVETFRGKDGGEWLRLTVPVRRAGKTRRRRVELPSAGLRKVRSSTGHSSWRHWFRTRLTVGAETWTIAVTLSDRSEMQFPMLIGRSAIRNRFLVHTGRSYLQPLAGE